MTTDRAIFHCADCGKGLDITEIKTLRDGTVFCLTCWQILMGILPEGERDYEKNRDIQSPH
jgi:recombinational DNA repair protein (RecF pathway)